MESDKSSGFRATVAVDSDGVVATLLDTSASSKPVLPEATTPSRIGRYLIVDELGRGAMGVVYAAYPDVDL